MSKQEIKIITKIIRELSLYLMMHGYKKFGLELNQEEKVTYFILTITKPQPSMLETMKEKIKREREMEIETYGWELIGEMDSKSELEILGLLIDDLEIIEKEAVTTLILTRKNRYIER